MSKPITPAKTRSVSELIADKAKIIVAMEEDNTKETLLKMVQLYDTETIYFALSHICKNDKSPRRLNKLKAMVDKMMVLK